MKRYKIRDSRSGEKIKPRVFDVIVGDDGKMEIEVALKNGKRRIALEDADDQINRIKNEIE